MTCTTCGGGGWVVVPMPRCVWNGRIVNYVDRHGVDHGGLRTCAVTCDDCATGRAERDAEEQRTNSERAAGRDARRRPTFTQYCATIGGLDGAAMLRDHEIERAAKAREGTKPEESFEEMFPRLAARLQQQQSEAA